jgi:hypothetical protein
MPEQTAGSFNPTSRLILLVFNIALVLVCVGFIAYRVLNNIPVGSAGLNLVMALGLFLNHLVFQYQHVGKNITIVAYAYTAFMAIAIIWATI